MEFITQNWGELLIEIFAKIDKFINYFVRDKIK